MVFIWSGFNRLNGFALWQFYDAKTITSIPKPNWADSYIFGVIWVCDGDWSNLYPSLPLLPYSPSNLHSDSATESVVVRAIVPLFRCSCPTIYLYNLVVCRPISIKWHRSQINLLLWIVPVPSICRRVAHFNYLSLVHFALTTIISHYGGIFRRACYVACQSRPVRVSNPTVVQGVGYDEFVRRHGVQ